MVISFASDTGLSSKKRLGYVCLRLDELVAVCGEDTSRSYRLLNRQKKRYNAVLHKCKTKLHVSCSNVSLSDLPRWKAEARAATARRQKLKRAETAAKQRGKVKRNATGGEKISAGRGGSSSGRPSVLDELVRKADTSLAAFIRQAKISAEHSKEESRFTVPDVARLLMAMPDPPAPGHRV